MDRVERRVEIWADDILKKAGKRVGVCLLSFRKSETLAFLEVMYSQRNFGLLTKDFGDCETKI